MLEANRTDRDTIILDTAGRLHVDDELMRELQQIEKRVKPHQVLFVCDGRPVRTRSPRPGFNEALELDGDHLRRSSMATPTWRSALSVKKASRAFRSSSSVRGKKLE